MGIISIKVRPIRDKSIKVKKEKQQIISNPQYSDRFSFIQGKMKVQTELTAISFDLKQEQELLNKKFQASYFPTYGCTLRLNHLFEPLTKYPLPQGDQYYTVHDDMSFQELRQKWYDNTIVFDEVKNNTPDKYVLCYNLEFPIDPHETVGDLKRKVQMEKFDSDLVIRIYFEWQSPFQVDQNTAFNFSKFEEANLTTIQTAFRVKSSNPLNSCYFYVKTFLKTTIQVLKNELQLYLMTSKQVQYKNPDKPTSYRLKIRKDGIKTQKLKTALEDQKINFSEDQQELDFTNLDELQIRDICSPGDTIYIEFEDENSIQINKEDGKYKDKLVRIVCYERADPKKQVSSSKVIEKKVIQRMFSQIKNVKVSTLLHEQRIQDAILTSVSCQEMTIKPDDKFEKFQKLIQQSSKDVLQLYTFPENFLYYKAINELAQIEMGQIIDILREKNVFTEQARTKCVNKRESHRLKLLKLNNTAFQDENFLEPIVLYTSPYIYPSFNSSLRGNSISLIQKEKILNALEDHWHYPFSEKLLKSLNKLPNFLGKFYRGSVRWNYNYSIDQIIEWNNFISTSKEFAISAKFIANQLKHATSGNTPDLTYLFEIDGYSGKDIEPYSFFPQEKEVLLLPYSKFKVISQGTATLRMEKVELTWVRLVEIPIPKKIPGNIFVWIDANISENSKAFNKIIEVNQYKKCDLIQLVSNEHFELWLQEFKDTLTIPGVNVQFISNMNRPPEFKQQGLRTLEIIRSFNQTAKVIFYIGNVAKTREILTNYFFERNMQPDENIEVVQSLKSLNTVFQGIMNAQNN